jgi:cystathionine gamma-synthase
VVPENSYARDHNETVRQVEEILALMEEAEASLLFPSGMAAIAAVFQALPAGARLLVQSGIYWGTTKFIRDFAERRGATVAEVDASDLSAFRLAFDETKPTLVFIETPSNPWLKVTDIAAIAGICENATLVVDSTAATPVLSRPLALGADIVIHSATKALNGHSDVVGGVVATKQKDALWTQIGEDRQVSGAIMGPFEAWLLLRSLRTLPLRIARMCENTQAITEFLASHPKIESVLYPGLKTHQGHEVAVRQMEGGYGYLFSALVAGGREAALQVSGALNIFHRATSLGGVESLVEHRHTIEPHTGIPENLLRFSIGIENMQDLIADLSQALDQV